jgi:acyl-CoA thioester hydrolase
MRWADLDALGHVNNVVYVDYLQEARVDMLRVHARSPRTDDLAEGVLVASHRVTYLEPLLFDHDSVFIDVWVTEIKAASFTLAYEVYREHSGAHGAKRVVYLRASTLLTPYVFSHEAPRRLSAEEKAALEVYLHPEEIPHPHRIKVGEPRHTEVGHYPVKVRFSDVDVYGHVNNVKYFEYLQEGRVAAMTRLTAPIGAPDRPSMVVAQADMVYRAPMLLRPEPYDLSTWVARVGTTSVTLDSEIVDRLGDVPKTLARGRVVMVFFDPATGRAAEPSPQVRAALHALV